MKRWLEVNAGSQEVDGVSRHELFRVAAEKRMIDDVDGWMDAHDARALTAGTYNEENVQLVFVAARVFLPAAQDLFHRIEAPND